MNDYHAKKVNWIIIPAAQ